MLLKLWKSFYYSSFLYLSPANLSYMWGFGSLAGVFLVVQILTGLILSFWYVASPELAFSSVEYMRREVNFGWFFRYLHGNGASFFFLVVFLHRCRTRFYGSFISRALTWISGFIIFVILCATAFFGYVLPWGQRSFWAATVITSLVSVIPVVGNDLLLFLWGGFSIGGQTLSRFYSIHFLLPFILTALVRVHLFILHEEGSSDPLSDFKNTDKITFHPFFTVKDILGILICLIIYLSLVFFIPNFLSHPINYVLADPAVTPIHIVPEWYFLPFYGILRSIPSKLGGIVCLIIALILLAFLPFFNKYSVVRGAQLRNIYYFIIRIFFIVLILIGYFGGMPVESPFYEIGQILTFLYFFVILILRPLGVIIEHVFDLFYFHNILKKNIK